MIATSIKRIINVIIGKYPFLLMYFRWVNTKITIISISNPTTKNRVSTLGPYVYFEPFMELNSIGSRNNIIDTIQFTIIYRVIYVL